MSNVYRRHLLLVSMIKNVPFFGIFRFKKYHFIHQTKLIHHTPNARLKTNINNEKSYEKNVVNVLKKRGLISALTRFCFDYIILISFLLFILFVLLYIFYIIYYLYYFFYLSILVFFLFILFLSFTTFLF